MKPVFACKNLFVVWISVAVCVMAVGTTFAESVSPDDDSQYSTTGPVPPPEVLARDAEKALQPAFEAEDEVVLEVPAYLWRHGCGPTALGMVIGYYDHDNWGYDDFVPGDAFTQTDAVNQSIASQKDPAHPRHYEDYSLPLDSLGFVLPDKSGPPVGDEHPNDCLGDFMRTSWSSEGMCYGWSKDKYMGPSFVSYVNMRNPTYGPRYEFLKMSTGTLSWDILVGQIDCGKPMVFLVDTDGSGGTDHFVTAVGYRDQPTQQYGCWDTWGTTVRWENFRPMAPGTPWGIASGWAFFLGPPGPVMHLEQNSVDIPNKTSIYDFGEVKVGFSNLVTFTIKSLAGQYLDLTGSPPVQISGANADDFVVSQQPLTLIPPGESVTFEITFAPTEPGPRTAMVSIPNTDSDRDPYTFSITGNGTGSVQIIYVDADANGTNDGTTWANAYKFLQDALAVASGGDCIKVAQGTYKPDRGVGITPGNRTAAFQLKNGITLTGGYAGFGEPNPDARDIAANKTVLSGDIGTVDLNSDNSYHVVTGSGTNNTAVLDGFTITAGNANGSSSSNFNGGGIYNSAGSPTISNCLITNNSAYSTTTRPWPSFLGGGMYNYQNSSPTVTNCTFSANNSCAGGGIANFGGCNPVLNNCTFSANSIQRSNPSSEIGYGGAMFNGNSNPVIKSCIFIGNSSSDNAGGIWNSGSNPTITNCTFVANSALWGGGIVNFNQSNQKLTNCIFWGNRDQSGTGQLAQIYDSGATSVVSYCCVQGWSSGGTGNINNNPSLAPDNYHLTANSPCINTGTNTPTGGLTDTDIDGHPRIQAGTVDIGADEFDRHVTAQQGKIVGWGYNYYGQCNVPLPNTGFVAVAGGAGHSLGLKSDGSIVAWGDNCEGQCNLPSPNTGFVAVAAGYYHSLGLKTNGSIVTWGNNEYGQCNVPSPNTGLVAVAAGVAYSLGLKADGSIVAWGHNYYGQCNVPSPNTGFTAVAAGFYHSLGLKTNGSIVAWGWNGYGQCNVPSPNTGFTAVAAGTGHSLGIQKQNTPPVANAGPDQTVYAGSDCMAEVTLNGSDSNDPDGDPLTYTWKLDGQIPTPTGGDGIINMLDFAALSEQWSQDKDSLPDLSALTKAWLTTPDDPNWNPRCDIASDGAIIIVNLSLGEHRIELVVNDGTDDSELDEVIVTVLDNTPPVITLNGLSTLVLECGVDTYTEPGATALDNCAGSVQVVIGGDTVDTLTCGTYIVTYTAADPSANSAQVTRTVIVQDTTAPVITLNGSSTMVLECGIDTYLEAGATALDSCAGSVQVVIGGDTVDTSTCGTYLVTYTAADPSANSTQVTRTVIVQDTTPPNFTLSVTPTVLWSPDHKMVRITPSWIVTDNCDQSPQVSLVTITSSEEDDGLGDGDTSGDIEVRDDGSIYLRAERSGTGTGRIYTITFRAVDDFRNTAISSATVTVPHDQAGSK